MSRVGNFLGKLFSGQPAGGDVPLRAYGKLPMYAEYRRLEVAPGTPTAFTQWMDAGRLAWVQAASQRGHAGSMVASRLVIQLPGSRDLVLASIWDSRDTVGRLFPFSFFVVCPPDALGKDALERWAAALSVFEQFDGCHGELKQLGSGGDFYRLFRARHVRLRPDDLADRARELLDRASRIDAAEWFQSCGLPPGAAGDWFAALARRATRWKQQPAEAAQAAIGCPLAGGLSLGAQVAMWLRWLEPLARATGRMPWLVSPARADGAARYAYLLLRDPMPGDFQLLTSQAADYGFVENLHRVAAGTTPGSADGAAPGSRGEPAAATGGEPPPGASSAVTTGTGPAPAVGSSAAPPAASGTSPPVARPPAVPDTSAPGSQSGPPVAAGSGAPTGPLLAWLESSAAAGG